MRTSRNVNALYRRLLIGHVSLDMLLFAKFAPYSFGDAARSCVEKQPKIVKSRAVVVNQFASDARGLQFESSQLTKRQK